MVRAAEWYRRAAEQGHPDAQYNLGFMYLLGEGVPSDADEGLRLLRRAADQEAESAFRLLADVYRNGYYGVPLDLAEATRWDERSKLAEQKRAARQAEAGDPPADRP